MNNNDDHKTNIQQDAFKNIQATSVSIGSINQSAQSFFKLQSQESDITSRSQLLKYLKGKVEGWKEDYLFNNEWLQPLLQDRDELVAFSNSREKGIPGKPHSQQFLQISIKDFFKKERITGRLLILGNPGAGKTAAKMQIAEDLIICAENNYSEPIPFWFDLSSWNEQCVTAISLSFTQKIPVNNKNQQLIPFIQEWTYSILGWILKVVVGWFMPPIALLRGLLIGLTGPNIDLKKRAVPNQGIHQSLINTVPFAFIFGLLGLIFGLSFKLYESCANDSIKYFYTPKNINFSIFFASLGVLLGMSYTCLPVIQHFALRLVLYQDDLVPFKYADFLEHTKKYRLTQTYGGRYSYIHDLLRDYFANLRQDDG